MLHAAEPTPQTQIHTMTRVSACVDLLTRRRALRRSPEPCGRRACHRRRLEAEQISLRESKDARWGARWGARLEARSERPARQPPPRLQRARRHSHARRHPAPPTRVPRDTERTRARPPHRCTSVEGTRRTRAGHSAHPQSAPVGMGRNQRARRPRRRRTHRRTPPWLRATEAPAPPRASPCASPHRSRYCPPCCP
jgi:hypothetical protein